jgi:hypothetical protein
VTIEADRLKFMQRLLSETVMSCPPCSTRVTASDNAITNGLEVFRERSGATRVMASNNDNMLRVFDAATLKCIRCVARVCQRIFTRITLLS